MPSSTKARPGLALKLAALIWLLLALAGIGHASWLLLGKHVSVNTDILAMLPQKKDDQASQRLMRQLADSASGQIVVLISADNWPHTRAAGQAFARTLARTSAPVSLSPAGSPGQLQDWLTFYQPYRYQLLDPQTRAALSRLPTSELAGQALGSLYQPMGMPRFSSWSSDPLNTFGSYLAYNAQQSPVRERDGVLSLSHDGRDYVLLMLALHGSAYSMTAQHALMPSLQAARQAVQQLQGRPQVWMIGVPMYAASAASQAQHEVDTIGIGSLVGIILLTLLTFKAICPRILVTVSILVGLACALSVASWLFGQLHLITLVFGASLIGVAENYGTNYFCNRLGRPAEARWRIVREQSPSMLLAMLTTTIGYALLAFTPFPGLQQIAVFSATGLISAFLTTLLLLPFADGGKLEFNALSRAIGQARRVWPRLQCKPGSLLGLAIMVSIILAGALRLNSNDDIRALQNAPDELVQQQRTIDQLLQLPNPAQFYLVSGASPEQVLQREELLKIRLDTLVSQHILGRYQAISDWVPSARQQQADAQLIARRVFGASGIMPQLQKTLGQASPAPVLPAFAPLSLQAWLRAPVSLPLRAQWLGKTGQNYSSVVLLRGELDRQHLAQLAQLAAEVPGVRWVDKVAEISAVMQSYRHRMLGIIAISYLLVLAALCLKFGRQGWRALAPTAMASLLTVALLALAGQSLQLFNVLALLLILGMGVDYGIFLLAQPDPNEPRPFLSVSLAAISTLLSFGLLALSATPALSAFGLTMLGGIALSWLLTPFFLPSPTTPGSTQ